MKASRRPRTSSYGGRCYDDGFDRVEEEQPFKYYVKSTLVPWLNSGNQHPCKLTKKLKTCRK